MRVMDLAALGAAMTLIAGAALSAAGGYAARRREDIRARRVDILTARLPEVHWARVELREVLLSPGEPDAIRAAALRFERATASLAGIGVSCSPPDAKRTDVIRVEAVSIRDLHGFLDPVPSPRPEDAVERVLRHLDSVEEQIEHYLSWLNGRINRWL